MSKQHTPATDTPEPAKRAQQWAAERARLATTGLVGGRFAALADMLATADVMGETRVTFAQANERMGSKRTEGPAGAASWRTLLQRFAQVDAEGGRWRIDGEAGAIVRRDA